MLEGSAVLRFATGVLAWFGGVVQNSRIIQFFLSPNEDAAAVLGSWLNRVPLALLSFFRRIFAALRLDALFANSIFRLAFWWCLPAAVLAPFLPTLAVLALVAVGFLSVLLSLLTEKAPDIARYPIQPYILLYVGIYLFGTVASVTLSGSLFGGLLSVLFVLFALVLMQAVRTKQQAEILLALFLLVGGLVAVYGFYQYLFPAQFSGMWHDQEMFESISFRVYSTLGNPNVLGEYLLLVIPFAFAFFLNMKRILPKLFFLGLGGAMLLCLILTYSRGCYIGILVAGMLFLVLLDRRFIFLGILGLLALPFVLPPAIIDRFLSIGNLADSSTSYRVYIWLGSIAMLKDYWFSGIGPGTAAFNQVYPAYAFSGIGAPHSHNLYLQILCDAGVLALILFGLVVYQFYKACFRALATQAQEVRVLLMAAISAMTGFLIQGMFDYTFYNYRVMLVFWVVLAMGIVLSRLPQKEVTS